ncbi:MAG TPA: bifunctional demethylmenaquinone methyltransferase/2-methoxy-6-polyprenyl-1,4-benzoquinol methylase UbiE [Ignavibacteriaceae bacterium]|nr:bifunctional demethylmenaquinone methyltransferase/2-methoxy-6-polyprenyl-1,4-benzoquinol methylase UbiE [Ignavibacteriaceae bacterium]
MSEAGITKKTQVRRIFETIAPRYDLLNHLLSFGFDIYWRKKALKLTGINSESILLDAACGTGDVAIEAKKLGAEKIFGCDFSLNMLKLFQKKSLWAKTNLIQATAESIPVKNNSVTNITVAFGVRNFYDIREGFKSFYNILKKNGRLTIIEFSLPKNFFFRTAYSFYFKKILPLTGRVISGDKEAYSYLPESVQEFDEKVDLKNLLNETGFTGIRDYRLTLGIVQVLIALK